MIKKNNSMNKEQLQVLLSDYQKIVWLNSQKDLSFMK